jgi:TPP-dependent pyruvate/acetoin dehydrogenase alpha subunit
MGTALERHQAQVDITMKAAGYGVPATAVDGMDVKAVETATRAAIDKVRAGAGPYLLEFRTYRFRAHSMYDPELYRSKEEVQEWKKRCPIGTFEAYLSDKGLLLPKQQLEMETAVAKEVDDSVAFAEAGEWEPVDDLLKDVTTLELN